MTSSRFGCRHFDGAERILQSPCRASGQKERGSNLRWSPSTVGALPGMCPNRSCGCEPWGFAPRENLHVVSALRVLGDIEAFTLGLDVDAQADDDVDYLVENRRTDARPH